MGRRLRVQFVGMERAAGTMPPDYLQTFVQFHLELPYYYARHSPCDVLLYVKDCEGYKIDFSFIGGGSLTVTPEIEAHANDADVVIHWRKWAERFRKPGALNAIISQDHSYTPEWLAAVRSANEEGFLDGILVFPGWHSLQVGSELKRAGIFGVNLFPGLTLGVDPDIYRPAMAKDPHHLLWASDPGRGLAELIPLFLRLHARDRRYHLTVTYPDYVKPESMAPYAPFLAHPAVKHHPSVRNGPILWDLFNSSGVLPYTSMFMEPSSRCHRQAMAAGSLVCYPPDRGTPSELLENGITGIVERMHLWPELIHESIASGRWAELGHNARSYAVSEAWEVQAKRFYNHFLGRVAA